MSDVQFFSAAFFKSKIVSAYSLKYLPSSVSVSYNKPFILLNFWDGTLDILVYTQHIDDLFLYSYIFKPITKK